MTRRLVLAGALLGAAVVAAAVLVLPGVSSSPSARQLRGDLLSGSALPRGWRLDGAPVTGHFNGSAPTDAEVAALSPVARSRVDCFGILSSVIGPIAVGEHGATGAGGPDTLNYFYEEVGTAPHVAIPRLLALAASTTRTIGQCVEAQFADTDLDDPYLSAANQAGAGAVSFPPPTQLVPRPALLQLDREVGGGLIAVWWHHDGRLQLVDGVVTRDGVLATIAVQTDRSSALALLRDAVAKL